MSNGETERLRDMVKGQQAEAETLDQKITQYEDEIERLCARLNCWGDLINKSDCADQINNWIDEKSERPLLTKRRPRLA